MTYAKNDFSIPQFIEIDDKTDRGSIFSRNGSGEYTMEGYYVFIPSKKYPVIYKKECIGLVEIEDCQMTYHDNTGTTSIFYHVVQISQEDANAFTRLYKMNASMEVKEKFATPGSMGYSTRSKNDKPQNRRDRDSSPKPWEPGSSSKNDRIYYRHTKDTGRFDDL